MATSKQWIEGARLRTLPMAVAPVVVGSAAAYDLGSFRPREALLAAGVALLLQVGVNYANDYSDGIRGTDARRVGPLRLVGSGAASPKAVKAAAMLSLGLAMLVGVWLVALSGAWWMLAVGLACVLAAWGYTGGPRPYGYRSLGELFVFIFFGLVATLGTTYTQVGRLSLPAFIGAIGTGTIAMALLMANNVRDIPTDVESGKRTLAVNLGDHAARIAYVSMLALPILLTLALFPARPWALLVLALVPASLPPSRTMLMAKSRESLIPVLQQTGLLNLAYSALFTAAMVLSKPL